MMKKAIPPLALWLISGLLGISAVTVEYKPVGSEPAFSVDIPEGWERFIHTEGKHGQVLFYNSRNDKNTYIEIRSIALDSETTTRELMHQLTARLSLRFYFVELQKEEPAPFRPDIHMARWKISDDNKTFLATTAVTHQGKKALMLIAIAPMANFRKQSIFFDNAILSLKFTEGKKQE